MLVPTMLLLVRILLNTNGDNMYTYHLHKRTDRGFWGLLSGFFFSFLDPRVVDNTLFVLTF